MIVPIVVVVSEIVGNCILVFILTPALRRTSKKRIQMVNSQDNPVCSGRDHAIGPVLHGVDIPAKAHSQVF